jgi:hypothetical protein
MYASGSNSLAAPYEQEPLSPCIHEQSECNAGKSALSPLVDEAHWPLQSVALNLLFISAYAI